MSHIVAMIMAAGRGDRFGAGVLKQFALVHARPAVAWSIERFAACPDVKSIVVVTPPGDEGAWQAALAEPSGIHVDQTVAGGETRQDSVWLGLQALPEETTHVLVHDAARPCLSDALVASVIEALRNHDAVVPTVPVVDTLVREVDGAVDAILDRARLAGVQTPQAFAKGLLSRAHQRARANGYRSSDDGSLVLALGEKVVTVPGESTNIKITYREDLLMAEAILARRA